MSHAVKPTWQTLAERLVIQAQRDIQQQRRLIIKVRSRHHAVFGLEQRAHVKEDRK